MKLRIRSQSIIHIGITASFVFVASVLSAAIDCIASDSDAFTKTMNLASHTMWLCLGVLAFSLELYKMSAVETWCAVLHSCAGKALLHLAMFIQISNQAPVPTTTTQLHVMFAFHLPSVFVLTSAFLFFAQWWRFGIDKETKLLGPTNGGIETIDSFFESSFGDEESVSSSTRPGKANVTR